MKEMEKTVEQAVNKGTKMAKKSADDWMDYIQEHPLQTALFGLVAYFAVKGLLK